LSIANTVITQENTSLATMGTDQLLDLFTLSAQQQKGEDPAAKGRGKKGGADERKGGGLKAVLEGMEELWDERQYENEYSMNVFLQTLAK
jgi:TATA-binding protein-associated factor